MLSALISYTDDIFFAIIPQSIYLVYCCISFRWVTLNFSRAPIYNLYIKVGFIYCHYEETIWTRHNLS